MNFNIKFFSIIIFVGIFFLFLQVSIFNTIPLIKVSVNFLEVLALCLALFTGFYTRLFIIFYFGLLLDLWFASCSFYTLSFLAVINLIYVLSKNTRVTVLFIIVATIFATLLIEIINASLIGVCEFYSLFNTTLIYWESLIRLVIGNVVFSVIVYSVLKNRFKERNTTWF